MNKWLIRCIKSNTMLFSALLIVFGEIQASMGLFSDILTPRSYGLITIAVGVIVGVLRFTTTLPMEDK